MADTFNDAESNASVRQKLNQGTNELNTTRREWFAGFDGNRCYRLGQNYNLAIGGDPTDTPGGGSVSWLVQPIGVDSSITWRIGNTLNRVEAVIDGRTRTFLLRVGGNRGINPAAAAGRTNWQLEILGVEHFDSDLAPYYPVGALAYQGGRIYEMLENYTVAPTPDTDSNWKDVFADSGGGSDSGPGDGGGPVTPPPSNPVTLSIRTTKVGTFSATATLRAGFTNLPQWNADGTDIVGTVLNQNLVGSGEKTVTLTVDQNSLDRLTMQFQDVTGIRFVTNTGIRTLELRGNGALSVTNTDILMMPDLQDIILTDTSGSRVDSSLTDLNLNRLDLQNTQSMPTDAHLAGTQSPIELCIGGVGASMSAARLASFSSLEKLNVHAVVALNDSHTNNWANMRKLYAGFIATTDINDSGLANMPNLEILQIQDTNSNVTGGGIAQCPNLREIDLTNASNDTDGVLNALNQAFASNPSLTGGTLRMQGSAPNPTGNSSTARANLLSAGWTLDIKGAV